MKEFELLLQEAEEEQNAEEQQKENLRVIFNRYRNNMIRFIRMLNGVAYPNVDGQSDFKAIFEDYKKLQRFGSARTWWVKLSEELGVEQKFWRVIDKSENGVMDYRLNEYIYALIDKLGEEKIKPIGKRELVAAITYLTKMIRPSFRTKIFNRLSELEPDANLAGLNRARSIGTLEAVEKRLAARI